MFNYFLYNVKTNARSSIFSFSMYFTINTKTFSKYVSLAADIAMKDGIKEHLSTGMIKISAYLNMVRLDAYNGNASITVKVDQSEGYEYGGLGDACVRAKELINALKSFPPSEDVIVCFRDGKLKLSPASDIYDYTKLIM